MPKKKVKKTKKKDLTPTTRLPEQQAEEIKIIFKIIPPSHPDQELPPMEKTPPVPRGKKVKDQNPSPPIELDQDEI